MSCSSVFVIVFYYVFAMILFRRPQGRLVLPTESVYLNKVITYLLTKRSRAKGGPFDIWEKYITLL